MVFISSSGTFWCRLPCFAALLVPHQLPHVNNQIFQVADGKLTVRHGAGCYDGAVRCLITTDKKKQTTPVCLLPVHASNNEYKCIWMVVNVLIQVNDRKLQTKSLGSLWVFYNRRTDGPTLVWSSFSFWAQLELLLWLVLWCGHHLFCALFYLLEANHRVMLPQLQQTGFITSKQHIASLREAHSWDGAFWVWRTLWAEKTEYS